MKERPILFSGPMVRALLAGTKTQTRRVVKAKHLPWLENSVLNFLDGKWNQRPLPYGKPGDRLWVRETWKSSANVRPPISEPYIYAADLGPTGVTKWAATWKPSIHMPRHASRITLEIAAVRVERLQDISDADALAEGVAQAVRDRLPVQQCGEYDAIDVDPLELYRDLWESINGPGSWGLNPWVWVVEFRRLT